MRYLLDTNIAIALMRNHASVLAKVREIGQENIVLCGPVEAELWYGVAKSMQRERNRTQLLTLLRGLSSLPFAGQATQRFGDLRAHLARQGTPIGPYDIQIAAIALAHTLTLVTHNTREFARVPGLPLEDWLS